MRIHHLNCISSCPLGGYLMDGESKTILERGHLTNHCLLIEGRDELILVDTGFGLRDVANPPSRLSEFFLTMLKPDFRNSMTAYRQIQKMGFDPKDVRHIVLTHLDFDHAGGLDDFPQARVHLMRDEREAAFARETWLDQQRYRPQQWGTKGNWVAYNPTEGDSWFGFDCVRTLEGVSEDVMFVPLIGHTLGHAGVAVKRDDQWLLDAGDAYFYREEMNLKCPHCTPGLQTYQLLMDKDRKKRLLNQSRLRDLKRDHSSEVEIFCSHDVLEFEKLAGRSASWSAGLERARAPLRSPSPELHA